MKTDHSNYDNRVIDTLFSLQTRKITNIAQAAWDYNIDDRELRRRIKGIGPRSRCGGYNKTLSDEQEEALKRYINKLNEIEVLLYTSSLEYAANTLLRYTHPLTSFRPVYIVGSNWSQRFLRRNPQYYKRKRKPLSKLQKDTHDPKDIKRWFGKL